jgi:hypothetical protein
MSRKSGDVAISPPVAAEVVEIQMIYILVTHCGMHLILFPV